MTERRGQKGIRPWGVWYVQQGLANMDLWATSNRLPAFVHQVLLTRSYACPFPHHLWMLSGYHGRAEKL